MCWLREASIEVKSVNITCLGMHHMQRSEWLGDDAATDLKTIEEVIREDRPAPPHAQHTQDMPSEAFLCHAAITTPVCLLQMTQASYGASD